METSRAVQVRNRTDDDLPALRVLAEDVLELDGYPPRVPKDLDHFIAAPGALASFEEIDKWVAEGKLDPNVAEDARAVLQPIADS